MLNFSIKSLKLLSTASCVGVIAFKFLFACLFADFVELMSQEVRMMMNKKLIIKLRLCKFIIVANVLGLAAVLVFYNIQPELKPINNL